MTRQNMAHREGTVIAFSGCVIEINRILCPVDFSECSDHALDCAVAMAAWYGAGVTALHVFANWPIANMIPSLGPTVVEAISLRERDRNDLMRELRHAAAHERHDVKIDVLLREATDIHCEILHQAHELSADVIVMGSHGRSGFERLLVGSMTEKVLRKAECPVMVVPRRVGEAQSRRVQFKRILCPVDFADSSLGAVTYALSLAEEADAHLTLCHAIELPPELRESPMATGFNVAAVRATTEAACMQRLRALVPDSVKSYCTVDTAVAEGQSSCEILRLARERKSDIIVMGVHGRGAVDLMVFGSTTREVIQEAACPVLTIRGR